MVEIAITTYDGNGFVYQPGNKSGKWNITLQLNTCFTNGLNERKSLHIAIK